MTGLDSEDKPILGGMHICRPRPLLGVNPFGLRLISDLHIGANHVDYQMIEREISDAVKREDRVLVNGDILDLILPKDHKRYSPDSVHPRIGGRRDQVTAAIQWATELLSPAAHLIDMLGMGNHESAVEKWHGTDPVILLLYELEKYAKKRDPDHVIHYGGFTGFVDYRLRLSNNQNRKDGKERGARWVIYYHHGSGGNAPVTRGLIDFNRRDTFIDADAIWMGHKHQSLSVKVEKIRCPRSGDEPAIYEVRHISTGAYFKTYSGQSQSSVRKHGRRSNYAADAGLACGGRGGARVELRLNRHDMIEEVRVIQ